MVGDSYYLFSIQFIAAHFTVFSMHFLSFPCLLLALSSVVRAIPAELEPTTRSIDSSLDIRDPNQSKPYPLPCGGLNVRVYSEVVARGGLGELMQGYVYNRAGERLPAGVKRFKNPDSARRYMEAYRLTIPLRHSNLMRTLAVCEYRGSHFAVTEWVPGQTPMDLIRLYSIRTDAEVKKLLLKWLDGLSYMHENGLAHRDVKIDNFLAYPEEDYFKVVDYDLVTRKVRDVIRCGTRQYMSPEIVLADSYDTQLADVWAFGVVLLEIVSGRRPWSSPNDPEATRVWSRKTAEERERVLRRTYPVSRGLAVVLSKVICPEDQRRSMASLKRSIDLTSVLRDASGFAPRPVARRESIDEDREGTVCLPGPVNGTMTI
jgi:serine/threonine protein kinase